MALPFRIRYLGTVATAGPMPASVPTTATLPP